jgi:hypothetical protein
MTTAKISDRISELTPKLASYSRFIGYQSPELTDEDIFQGMALSLIEKDQNDPAFCEQKDSYLKQCAFWEGMHLVEPTHAYDRHVQEESVLFEQIPDEAGDPARIAEDNELMSEIIDLVSQMSAENIAIVKLFFLGYGTGEIASKMGISSAAVSQRKNTVFGNMRKALKEYPEELSK